MPSAPERPRKRSRMAILPVALFIVLAALFAFSLSQGDPSKLPSALIGKPAPTFALPALAGVPESGTGLTSADLTGAGPTVVNFWASWCQPCSEEHPFLVELAQKADARVVGINYKDQPDSARKFLARLGNPYSAIGTDMNGRAAIEWGVYGMPETFIVDGKGVITDKHVGPITRDVLEKKILPALAKAKAAK